MLQSGMRAPMGVKVKGPDLATIEGVGLQIEELLKEVPSVDEGSVLRGPHRREALPRDRHRQGCHRQIRPAREERPGRHRDRRGRTPVTTTVEGRERYPVRVRYARELRDSIESLGGVLVARPGRRADPLEGAFRDPLRPRTSGHKERRHRARRIRDVREPARLPGGRGGRDVRGLSATRCGSPDDSTCPRA